jgi:uncharacterized membrane protein
MTPLNGWLFALVFSAALGCGLMAGLFFAFSVSVMKALARLPPAVGIAAMQAINVAILNPVFGIAFFGTAIACLLVTIASFLRWHDAGAVYLLIGGMVYLAGSFLVTLLFNVPRNNTLASLKPADPNSARQWASYLAGWTAWNHVRTAAALTAAASLTVALCR